MSIETPKVEESTPIVTKPVESTTIPAETSTPAKTETISTLPPVEPAIQPVEPVAPVETAQNEAIVTAVPATEGVLGYKGAPGLLNKFRFVKHFFWFSEEPLAQEGVDAYIKNEKAELAHHNAAWAQETGKGVLFYAKRAEDKATPSGLILLADATNVTRIGSTDFSFKVGSHTHKFEASSTQEQDSWVVAIEKIVEESKDLKAEVTGRESYKKTIEGFAFSPIIAGSTTPVKTDTHTPKKSLDATTATNAAAAEPVVKADNSSDSSADEHKKNKEAEKQAKKDAKKERSQSRKRSSVFGLFGKKEEEKEIKKEEKKEEKAEKAEKKAEKEHAKELKKLEAEQKKEEAKAEHDATKAKEAAEAAAIAAAPAAVAASVEKKEEEKHHDKPVEDTTSPVTSPTEKKNKRASVFGGFFGNKNKVASPSVEKTEKEVVPEAPVQEEVPVVSTVSETAPRLEEPIDHKPIDTAAVTAPVDAADSSVAPTSATETKPLEPVAATDSTLTPKTEKKSFFAGLIKKQEKKEEVKEEKTNEEAAKEVAPVAAPVVEPETTTESTPVSAPVVTEPAVETPVKDVEAPKEERPAREKRRTSLFGSLGTLKRKTDKSPEPSSAAAVSEDAKSPEVKREKSPLPAKLGGLFRKPSRSAKDVLSVAEEGKTETTPVADATKTHETPLVTSEHDTPANATVIEHTGDSKIIGDVIPSDLHSTVHDAVTQAPEATKSTV